MEVERISSDILIIGGGIAGLMAAIHAKKTDNRLRVLLVDKGTPGASGASAFAAGILNYCLPGDDMESYTEEIITENSEYLIDQEYVQQALPESYELFQELLSYGVRFMKDDHGNIIRVQSLGSQYGCCSPYDGGGPHLMWKIRSQALRRGVGFFDRLVIINLLKNEGRCLGAVGFGLDNRKIYIFSAKAVIMGAGSLHFFQAPMGSMGAGDGAAMALRAGAELRGMEQVGYVQIGPKGLGSPGLHIIFGCGGHLVNAQGERFMARYQPKLMEEAKRYDLAKAILQEWIEGRGPCYVDCTHLAEDMLRVIRISLPLVTRNLASKGLDWGRDKIEYIPYGLQLCSAGGVRIKSIAGETTMEGLWTPGYTGDFCGGVFASAVGSLCGSGIQGRQAGRAAAQWIRERGEDPPGDLDLEDEIRYVMRPWSNTNGNTPQKVDQLLTNVLRSCFRNINMLKNAERLQLVLDEARDYKEQLGKVTVQDTHHLKKWHETSNVIQLMEVVARASLLREESRRAHFRQDFPDRNDHDWLKWVLARLDQKGNIQVWAEDIPIHKWPYRPF